MGVIKVQVPDKVEEMFRMLAMKRFGYRKGSISEAAKEAVEKWNAEEVSFERVENPTEKMRGMLRHVKKNSVELQHEAWNGIYKKYANRR